MNVFPKQQINCNIQYPPEGPPVTGPPKRRAQRPGTAPARKSTPTSRPATARPTYAAAAASKPKTTNVKGETLSEKKNIETGARLTYDGWCDNSQKHCSDP